MVELLELLAAPLAACVVLTGIHCYLGLHVLMRQVIFVDLALAQVAALGASVGVLLGFAPDSMPGYGCALGLTFVGAAVFALGRFRDRRVPQEAIIGIVYAVSSALAILLVSKTAIEREHIQDMLVGRLLFVDWLDVGRVALLYAAIAVVHVLLRRRFFAVTTAMASELPMPAHSRLWDFVFYVTFGFVVTSSVHLAGVLLVFSFLIVPAACAALFAADIRRRLIVGWLLGLLASAAGLAASAQWDLPTGASVVAAFGVLFAVACAVRAVLGR